MKIKENDGFHISLIKVFEMTFLDEENIIKTFRKQP
jgi:hypothetical protein